MKVKAAIMKAPGSFTVSGSSGHTIQFLAGEERFVPPSMVAECEKYGARQVKRFRDLSADVPETNRATMQSTLIRHTEVGDITNVEEVDSSEYATETAKEDTKVSPGNVDVRSAIAVIVAEKKDGTLTADGLPKMNVLNAVLSEDITVSVRDEVVAAMREAGELPAKGA